TALEIRNVKAFGHEGAAGCELVQVQIPRRICDKDVGRRPWPAVQRLILEGTYPGERPFQKSWALVVNWIIPRVYVDEDDPRMVRVLGQRVVEEVADAKAPPLAPLRLD